MYSSLLPSPPFNKFTVFIPYGLLSVALITLAQEDSIGNAKSCIVDHLPVAEANKQVTIGYVRLFSTNQPKSTPEIPIPKIQWNNYDYINVIGDSYDIFRPKEKNKLNPINDLILLSIRNYDVGKWPKGLQEQQEYQRIISDAIKIINEYQLNGIDIEYPGMRGSLCKRPDGLIWDKINDDNFINFLKNLREALNGMEGPKILMLTVGRDFISKFKTPDDNNYRSYPNSPLDEYQAAYLAWIGAGINSNKIIMSVDFGNTVQMVPNVAIKQSQYVDFPKSVSTYDFNKLNDQIQSIIDFCFKINSILYSWPWKYLSNTVLNSSDRFCTTINPNWTRKFESTDNSGTPWLYSVPDPNVPFNHLYVSSLGGISISDVSYDDNYNNLLNFMQPIRGIPVPIDGGSSKGSPSNKSGNENSNDQNKKNKGGIIAGSIIGAGINPESSSNRVVSAIQNERRTIDHLTIE
ncbi:11588_t:CDS:2 [Funneliformis caledonium]|uniref:11588_t:CDS:1 n=1 Tax=Funneliformis caledonium TaxID=1117310 RepID=A0A9N9ACM7_9GLOM|nr:11588_t:CDS:2 [Funneliformis caledonium]